MKKWLFLVTSVAISLMIGGCGKKSNTENRIERSSSSRSDQTNENVNEQATPKGVVCVWDGVPVRTEPTKAGKFLSSISLGETVTSLNETSKDAADKDREYIKIQLSDGKEGWAPVYGLVQDAMIGAIKESALIYKRPDLLTVTSVRFESMELVAIAGEKEDWFQVIGENKKKAGWIKKELVTTNKEDVAVAVIGSKELRKSDATSRPEKIKNLIENSPYPESYFIEKLKKQIEPTEQTSDSESSTVNAPDSAVQTGSQETEATTATE